MVRRQPIHGSREDLCYFKGRGAARVRLSTLTAEERDLLYDAVSTHLSSIDAVWREKVGRLGQELSDDVQVVVDGAAGPGIAGVSTFAWSQLVARLLHPIKVQIIETLLWVDRPLSANELSKIYLDSPGLNLCAYHVRCLVKWGVLEEVERKQRRGVQETFLAISSEFSGVFLPPQENSAPALQLWVERGTS